MVEEGVTRATALRAGEVDVADYVPREYVERLSRAPEMTMLRRRDPAARSEILQSLETTIYGAQVLLVILGYGIGRQAIVKTALLGLAQPLWSFVPPERRRRRRPSARRGMTCYVISSRTCCSRPWRLRRRSKRTVTT